MAGLLLLSGSGASAQSLEEELQNPPEYLEAFGDRHVACAQVEVVRLYQAVFGRQPDVDGLRFWLDEFDSGSRSTRAIADHFAESREFSILYGAELSDAEFVAAVYPNVLGRSPDAAGSRFWVDFLERGGSRGELVLLISNAPEFIMANNVLVDGAWYEDPAHGLATYNDDLLPVLGSPLSAQELEWAENFADSLGLSVEETAESIRLQRHSHLIDLTVEDYLGPNQFAGVDRTRGPFAMTIRIDRSASVGTEARVRELIATLEIAPFYDGLISFERTDVSVADLFMTFRSVQCFLQDADLSSWALTSYESRGYVEVVTSVENRLVVLEWLGTQSLGAPVIVEIGAVEIGE